VSSEIKELDARKCELIGGGGGVFDVVVDGRLIFSKHQTGRFPEPGEIAGLVDN
jgi:selT/selW/selH-like putative selenoprotein|tara:strand:+ start:7479 stop:7640 length:162 start_codon:yes stop_codon:yes gene_type:complete